MVAQGGRNVGASPTSELQTIREINVLLVRKKIFVKALNRTPHLQTNVIEGLTAVERRGCGNTEDDRRVV